MQTLKPAALVLVLWLVGCTAPNERGAAPKASVKSPDVIAHLAVGGVT